MSLPRPPVTILTSGVGLGTYVPSLLIERRLRRHGCAAEVEVLEAYYTPRHQQAHLAQRRAQHANFALAQIAHRMTRDVAECLDPERIARLVERWERERRTHFIVWSGFWLPVVERYRERAGALELDVDHCRIDAEISASFRIHRKLRAAGNEIWLWNWAEKRLVHEIPVTAEPPIPFAERPDRLVVHGGGWGLGTYRSRAAELGATRFALDVVIDHAGEPVDGRADDRAFMPDPEWHPWSRDAQGAHAFPPMHAVGDAAGEVRPRGADYHGFHDVIRESKAIVSKPGGGTLIDSLAAATPVVLLEPYGYAEKANGDLWEHLGFGIPYAAWRDTGFDAAVLARLHENIVRRSPAGTDYPRAYAERILKEGAA